MNIEVKFDVSCLERMARETPMLFERTVQQMGQQVEGDAKRLVKGSIGGMKAQATGNLRGSIGLRMTGALGSTAAEIYATAKYAEFVHEGTGIYGPLKRPFIVRARRAKALAFMGKAGSMVFRRQVTIQGMRPRPFLAEAARRVLPPERRGKILGRVWGKWGGGEI